MSDQAAAPALETTIPSTETPTTTPPPPPNESVLGEEPKAPLEAFDPEKLTLPEGITKDEALFGEFTNLAKEHGLAMPVAQNLLALAAKQSAAVSQKLQADWDKQNADWQAEIKADKEIGGDKLDGALQTFAKVANDPELSDPKLREALAFTGAGNHPAIVRTLVRWAKALSEGGPVRGAPATARAPGTLGEAIYGSGGPHVGGPRLS